jgi:hypothetical protein
MPVTIAVAKIDVPILRRMVCAGSSMASNKDTRMRTTPTVPTIILTSFPFIFSIFDLIASRSLL